MAASRALVAVHASAEMQIDRIADFLRRRVEYSGKNKIVLVALVHMTDSGAATVITRPLVPSNEGDALDSELLDVANEFHAAALQAVEAFNRPQRYGIIVYQKNDVPVGQYPFMVSPSNEGMIGGETEPANVYGVTSQQMRLTEGFARLAVQSHQQTMEFAHRTQDRLEAECDRLRTYVAQLETRHFETIRFREELLDQKAKRDLETEEARKWSERVDKLFEHFDKMILPGVIERYSPMGPLKSFFQGLEHEQLIKLGEILKPEQLAKLKQVADLLQKGPPLVEDDAPPATS